MTRPDPVEVERVWAEAEAARLRDYAEQAHKLHAYLSSLPSGYRVGPCRSCGETDCLATAQPAAAKLIYINSQAYIGGGLCCAHNVKVGREWEFDPGDCAHPMIEK